MSTRRSTNAPRVTDHAVLRFIERRCNIDVEAVRKKIDDLVAPAIKAGARTVKADGVQFIIHNGHVVTTLANGMGTVRTTV